MCPDPYVNKLLNKELPCTEKTDVVGRVNCTLHARAEERGLELAPFPSRAILTGEIHELILTVEEAAPGARVNRIAYLGFFEITAGGILWAGDNVYLDGVLIGRLAGYDLTHWPNHFNIIVRASEPLLTGHEMGVHSGAELRFVFSGTPL